MACMFKDTIVELAHISAYSIEKGWSFGKSTLMTPMIIWTMKGVANIFSPLDREGWNSSYSFCYGLRAQVNHIRISPHFSLLDREGQKFW